MKGPPLHPHTGWLSWAVLFVVIVTVLSFAPDRRGVSHVYEEAAHHWIDGEPLYTEGYKGFLYAPQSAMTYVPFLFPTEVIGSFVWRLLGLALLATGLFRWTARLDGPRAGHRFTIATWLALPVAISSLRNGQSNLHLAGLFLHGSAAWAAGGRASVSAWLTAGLLAKPLALVLALLAGATERRLVLALVVGLAVFVVLPLAHAQPDYAWGQVEAFADKLVRASDPGDHVYANLVGITQKAGLAIPSDLRLPLQVLGAVGALALALWARCRVARGALPFVVLAIAALYLMLFNPRNESNSFVLLAPIVAVLGAVAWTDAGRRGEAWFLTVVAVCLGCDNYGRWLHGPTDRWFKPFVALVFLGYFVLRLVHARTRPVLPLSDPDSGDRISA